MFNSKIKIVIFIFAFIIILLSLIIFLWPKSKKTNNTPQPSPSSIYPSKYPTPTTGQSNLISPTLIPPLKFTGALKETMPEEVQNLTDQKQNLRKKTPLQETFFKISFDYGEDKFIVDLNEPKDQSLIEFKKWLIQNYQSIPIDRFIIR